MKSCPVLVLVLASLFSACSTETAAAPPSAADQVETMNLAIAELMAREEHDADRVEVQHVLIAFAGAVRATTSRVRPDAEILAAEIYGRLASGEEIDVLMREYSDDPGAGIYIMNQVRPAQGEFPRSQMAKDFGDVAWRLEVGEIGVAPFHVKESPFGWHVIKRLN